MASTPVRYGWIDETGELSSSVVHVEELDNTNYDAIFDDTTGAYALLKAGLATLSLCNFTKQTASVLLDTDVGTKPSDKAAQRELAARVIYQDNVTGKKYRFDVPGPVATIFEAGTDEIDIVNNVVFAAFVTVFEANAVSPDGNAVTVLRAYRAGRAN